MSEDIRFERRGRLGVAILDRPAALNALTRDMVRRLSSQLAAWRRDPAIGAVLVKAVPGRAFCAGGEGPEGVSSVLVEKGTPGLGFGKPE